MTHFSTIPTFQATQFDPGLPRYQNTYSRLGRLKMYELDYSAFFAKVREGLREELEEILEAE